MLRRLIFAGVFLIACSANAYAQDDAEIASPHCEAPSPHARLARDLPRTAARLGHDHALTIVALGSSSTAGAGATKRKDYPSRLAAELVKRFPDASIEVVNRGVNGEEADQMVARIERDVLPAKPDLVIWQLGTNAVLRGTSADRVEAAMDQGLARLRADGIDVVVMDLQYAPRVIAMPGTQQMNERLEAVAQRHGVPVFKRYALMREWAVALGAKFAALIHPDGLHLNDASYGCLASQLASALAAGAVIQRVARP